MATKTISLELDAYEKLKAAKLDVRESFSAVVRRAAWKKKNYTCADLLKHMEQRAKEGSLLSEETLDRLEEAQRHPRRSPSHWDDPCLHSSDSSSSSSSSSESS